MDDFLRLCPKDDSMATLSPTIFRSVYVTGLRNAHALEHQALGVIDRQLDRLENFPEVSDRLRLHRGETEQQILRLDELLSNLNERSSAVKDTGLNLMGNLAALGHAVADDEILKNAFANCAFENFEIASYKSLLIMAEESGEPFGITALQQSLREEQRMGQWCDESIEWITKRYMTLRLDPSASNH
jgi:ferritin-like metal-binding protein YciE